MEFSKKAIALVESGKTLTGVQSFDKNATLAWLTQILAVNEGKSGSPAEAIKLYEKSTSLAPDDPQIAARNLLAVVTLRQAKYGEVVKAYNALPEADRGAAEPKPEVKAAKDALERRGRRPHRRRGELRGLRQGEEPARGDRGPRQPAAARPSTRGASPRTRRSTA